MSLTGIPLIVVTGFGGLVALVATIRLWSRGGRRRRLAVRTVGTVCAEVLIVATAGLIINRGQAFYPSWHDLLGDGITVTTAAPPPAIAPPPGDPRVVVPAGYATHPGTVYPVIVVLCDPADLPRVRAAASAVPDVVTVTLTAAHLDQGLIGELRVTDHDWALVADKHLEPAAQRLRADDGRVGDDITVVAGGRWASAFVQASGLLPAALNTASLP